jgi:competence protein ComEC|tara:strand:+ start:26911 stop:27768 length:858 start_codon:yes stop_codon:yes gene_type:complete
VLSALRTIKIFSVSIIVFYIFFCSFVQAQFLKIHFIDVGEGDSILIEAPSGECAIVDSGNPISGYKVATYLKKNKVHALEHLIFTHPHLDHVGGAFFILQMIAVQNICDNGENLNSLIESGNIYRWYNELVRENRKYRALTAEDKLIMGDVVLDVLWPPKVSTFSGFNANSLVLMLKYNNFRCLLTGDLTALSEKQLLRRCPDIKVDVLKVGHHGAADATSRKFLKKISPEISVISVNKNNVWGYPSKATINRLKASGSKIYRTDKEGDIVITVSKQGEIAVNKK